MAKRRANGEGNIRKRKDGRWEGRYTAGYDPETGKRIIHNVLGKTQAEVKEKLAAVLEESKLLDPVKAKEYTVASWLRTWYELYAKPNVRSSTAEYYRRAIESYVVPRIGDQVYGYKIDNRTLVDLKTDGTYSFSDALGINYGIATIASFSETGFSEEKTAYTTGSADRCDSYVLYGEEVPEDDFKTKIEKQAEKTDLAVVDVMTVGSICEP